MSRGLPKMRTEHRFPCSASVVLSLDHACKPVLMTNCKAGWVDRHARPQRQRSRMEGTALPLDAHQHGSNAHCFVLQWGCDPPALGSRTANEQSSNQPSCLPRLLSSLRIAASSPSFVERLPASGTLGVRLSRQSRVLDNPQARLAATPSVSEGRTNADVDRRD